MAALNPLPKSPAGLLLVGGLLWMLSQRKASAAPAGTVRKPVTAYSSPVTAGELLAAKVLAITKGLSGQAAAVQAEEATREDARKAVRAGDDYYGLGANAWYAGNTEAARRAMGEGGWSQPTITPTSGLSDRGTVGGETDTVPAAPVYDAEQTAMWLRAALFNAQP